MPFLRNSSSYANTQICVWYEVKWMKKTVVQQHENFRW